MPTPTYTYLDSVTLGSNASSVTLSNIDQNYGYLVLVIEAVFSYDGRAPYIRFNGDTGSNYNQVLVKANNTSPQSESNSNISTFQVAGYQNVVTTTIFDYAKTDKHKSILSRSASASSSFPEVQAFAGRWASTAAITSITVSLNADNLETGTTVYLYGIEA
tara:strand:+ start:205 stop:687 length:483 start_codon:yes stop_codon:yes gene_type:complete